jgi:hypothetical protein
MLALVEYDMIANHMKTNNINNGKMPLPSVLVLKLNIVMELIVGNYVMQDNLVTMKMGYLDNAHHA